MKGPAGRLLERPKVEVIEDPGVTSIYVRLQRSSRKAVLVEQPDPDILIYVNVDADGVPTGVMFHGSVTRAAMFRVLARAARTYLFREPRVVERFMQAFERAAEKMPERGVGAA